MAMELGKGQLLNVFLVIVEQDAMNLMPLVLKIVEHDG
jgi:hypothetical protein